jgi:hypothetical protein
MANKLKIFIILGVARYRVQGTGLATGISIFSGIVECGGVSQPNPTPTENREPETENHLSGHIQALQVIFRTISFTMNADIEGYFRTNSKAQIINALSLY